MSRINELWRVSEELNAIDSYRSPPNSGGIQTIFRLTKGHKETALSARILEDCFNLYEVSAEEMCKVDVLYFSTTENQR